MGEYRYNSELPTIFPIYERVSIANEQSQQTDSNKFGELLVNQLSTRPTSLLPSHMEI